MMKKPFYTIAIPCYNDKDRVKRAVDSCLNQDTSVEFEVLVIDNASDDGTTQILESISDDRIRVLRNNSTISIFANHNRCLTEAKGDYVLYCHSDDLLSKSALEIIDVELEKLRYPDQIVLWGHSLIKDFSLCLEYAGLRVGIPFSGMRAKLPFVFGGLTPCGTCFSRDSLLKIGGFIDVEHRLAIADTINYINMAKYCFTFIMIPQIFFIRRSASVAVDDVKFQDHVDAYCEGFKILFQKYLTSKEKRDLIALANSVERKPDAFLFFLMGTTVYRSYAIKKMIILLVKRPGNIIGPTFREFIRRLIYTRPYKLEKSD